MKVTEVKAYAVDTPPPHYGGEHLTFVKLSTDEGLVGYGEAHWVPYRPRAVVALIEDVGDRYVVGADPFRIEELWQKMYASEYGQHPDTTRLGVMSAFEIACWDIVGKATGQPIYNLLGGPVWDKLRSYTYLYPAPEDREGMNLDVHRDPKLAAERAVAYMEQGFTAVKFDPVSITGFAPRELSLEVLDNSEAVVASVREAVGSRCDILIGTHGQMNAANAIRLARRLEPYEPLWFEEPVPPENVDEMAAVAHATSIPVATGERLSTKYDFVELLEKQAAAILQPDLGRVGGILEAKKVAAMAEAHYVQMAPHLWCGPIAGAAAIHVDATCQNFLIQESIETWGGFHGEILKEPVQWEDGYIVLPTKPGLGVELNEEVAAAHSSL